LLNSLTNQISKYEDRIRVIVNDNNSDDGVNDNLKNEYFNWESLIYQKNESNIGGNANMLLGFIFAKPDEYLWILGDDDYLEEQALDYIFSAAHDNSDILVLSNSGKMGKSDYSFIKSYKDWMSFWVSTNIFNLKCFREHVYSSFYYHNTSYPHIAIQWLAHSKSHLSTSLIPLDKVLGRTISNENGTAENYSLAWTGALALTEILDKKNAVLFIKYWLRNYWLHYFENKKEMKFSYKISKLYILDLPIEAIIFYYLLWMKFKIFKLVKKGISLLPATVINKIKKSKLYNSLIKLV
jgi:hypothetical protein